MLLAYGLGRAMPTHVVVTIAFAVTAGVIFYCTRESETAGLSRLGLGITLGLLWLVIYMFVGSSTLFAYPIELPDDTTAWCLTGNVSLATTWTLACMLAATSLMLDAARERVHRTSEDPIISRGLGG